MATIYSPQQKGFSQALHAIDWCQVALLRELAIQAGQRLVLKGGMAMRASFGSLRLTRDMDFDRDVTATSLASVQGMVRSSMKAAAQLARLRDSRIDFPKATETTLRARLTGQTLAGQDLRFEVEVSGRRPVAPQNRTLVIVTPPSDYGIAPFPVNVYTHAMLAATKVLAVMSDNRNVPRDVYDLHDLLAAGADPVTILAGLPREALSAMARDVIGKLQGIGFDLARDELLPYLPPQEAATVDTSMWEQWLLEVAEGVEQWLLAALAASAGAREAGEAA